MKQSFAEVIRWLVATLLIVSGLSGLKSAVVRSWIGLFSILWLLASVGLILMGVLLFRHRSSASNTRRLRWVLGFIGLLLLPTTLGSLALLFPPKNAPGFGGAYAAGAVGQAFVLSLYASPIPGLVGYWIGLSLDIAKRNRQESKDEQHQPLD